MRTRLRSFRPIVECIEARVVPSIAVQGQLAALHGQLAKAKLNTATQTAPPPTLRAAVASATQVNLTWSKVRGASRYLVEELVASRWVQLAALPGNTTSYAATISAVGATYSFDVAIAIGRTQARTTVANVTIPATAAPIDHPSAMGTYTAVHGPLFGPGGPKYADVQQGEAGDCWLLGPLAAVAASAPQDITRMFDYDGTRSENGSTVQLFTVYFFSNYTGLPVSVVVDTELPDGGADYAHLVNGTLWPALVEKAYAEAIGKGYLKSGSGAVGDSYSLLNSGYPGDALQAITGHNATCEWTPNFALTANEIVVFGTGSGATAPADSRIVSGHCYGLVATTRDTTTPYLVYNPWGALADGYAPESDGRILGRVVASKTFLAQNFQFAEITYA
jgi:hypothetical protein